MMTAERGYLDILIHYFIRIQFRALCGKKQQPDVYGILLQPDSYLHDTMDGVAIDDQITLPIRMSDKPFQKPEKDLRHELALEHHRSTVGNRRYHTAPETLPRRMNYRVLSSTLITPAHRIIRTQFHFVTPVNTCLFTLRCNLDCGVFFTQTSLNRNWILLQCPAHRLLWGESPTCKPPSYRPHRPLDAESTLLQITDHLARPKCIRQLDPDHDNGPRYS